MKFKFASLAALAFCLSAAVQIVSAREKPNFTHYDTPLYEQIVQHIRDKVAARLPEGPLAHDRYFITPFAYENRGNDPKFSHSFMTVIRIFAHGEQPTPNSEFKTGTFKGWDWEAFNISWLPADFMENPDLCVFRGACARLFPKQNQCPVSPGKNFTLEDTIKLAVNAKVAVGMWGPYEITKEGFDRAIKRKWLLDSGEIKYRADDRRYRKDQTAINCFHAMGSLDEPFPNGGAFGTGFKMWGLNGTGRVLIEYKTRGWEKGLLLERPDVKKDRFGFVYAPARDQSRRVYNPFKTASAYQR
jgi:hypothetical protein